MSATDSQPTKPNRPLRALVWSLVGTVVGFVVGMAIVRELPGGIVGAIGGAVIGGFSGARIIQTTGWMMILGTILGGGFAIAMTGYGKAVIYGAPIGTGIGMCLGLSLERLVQNQQTRRLLILTGLITLAFGLIVGYWMTRSSLPEKAVSILEGATKVETFRVAPEHNNDPDGPSINGYPITATGKAQGANFATRLATVLNGGGVTRNNKKCGLRPGVAFRLWKDKESVDVLICFECDVLWPHVVGEPIENKTSEWRDFDPVRGVLLTLTKEAFPDDQEIQSLPKSRR